MEDKERPLADDLFVQFYDELRKVVAFFTRHGKCAPAAALVNLAFLRFRARASTEIADRAHFLYLFAQRMRRILTDHAKKVDADRRRGGPIRVTPHDDVSRLFREFAFLYPLYSRQAEIFELRYLMGLSIEEVARELGVPPKTVKDDTRLTMALLRRELR